jgi:general secretion pathway protein G
MKTKNPWPEERGADARPGARFAPNDTKSRFLGHLLLLGLIHAIIVCLYPDVVAAANAAAPATRPGNAPNDRIETVGRLLILVDPHGAYQQLNHLSTFRSQLTDAQMAKIAEMNDALEIKIKQIAADKTLDELERTSAMEQGTRDLLAHIISLLTEEQRAILELEFLSVKAPLANYLATGQPNDDRAKITAAKTDVAVLEMQLELLNIDMERYATTEEGLNALVTNTGNSPDWHGPYLRRLPLDPWGNPYIYVSPGKHNAAGVDISSAGPDGKPDTDDDITNWL